MLYPTKVCPVVIRECEGRPQILAFAHPLAGKQFVKGTREIGEDLLIAARRELREESGLSAPEKLTFLGSEAIGDHRQVWAFFAWISSGLPDAWSHQTEDDQAHTFTFFWHPLDLPLNDEWHSIFHEAFAFFAPLISAD